MRLAVLVTSAGGVNRVVLGTYGTTRDGYAFPGERLVRLPRRLTRGGRRFEDAFFFAKRGMHP